MPSHSPSSGQRIRTHREHRGWSQQELADRAGLSRTAVSAIERDRLSPSVAAALALAGVFQCSVESLFAAAPAADSTDAVWAWPPRQKSDRHWLADVGPRRLRFPAEPLADGERPCDAPLREGKSDQHPAGPTTLVVAGCDPAAGLLARLYEQMSGYRMLTLVRSSRAALTLLQMGLVHAAGVHLSDRKGAANRDVVRNELGPGYRLLRAAEWESGIALARDRSAQSVRQIVQGRTRWVAREPGSGARQRLDQLFHNRRRFDRIADDHRTVAAAIRSGWADAGVCVRLVSDQSGLGFKSLGWDQYDLCLSDETLNDPRGRVLLEVVRSAEFRRQVSGLPGYDGNTIGTLDRS